MPSTLTAVQRAFIEGFTLGNKLDLRRREPTTIPVTSIQAIPAELTMRPGDRTIITFILSPTNPSVPRVDCTSSDASVAAVNRLDDLTWEVIAIESGTIQIRVVAVDGYGATTTVNVNVLGKTVFDTLTFNTALINLYWTQGEILAVFNYTPIDADGKNIKIELNSPLSGNDTPWIVEDTCFDNIKKIKAEYESLLFNDYVSSGNNLGYNVRATDGSGLVLLNRNFNIGNGIQQVLYGTTLADSLSATVALTLGCENWAFAQASRHYQSYSLNAVSYEITEGQNLIEIDSQYVVKAKGVGTAKVVFNIANKKTMTFTYNITDSEPTGSRTIDFIDERGQVQGNTYNAWYTLVGKRYRPVSTTSQGIIITKIETNDQEGLKVDGQWVTPLKNGTYSVKVTYKRFENDTEQSVNVTMYCHNITAISCGTCSSDYLKEGVAVWVGISGNVYYVNGLNINRVDIIAPANEVIQDGYIYPGGTLATVTFNRDGESGRAASRPIIYHFKKLVNRDVKIRIQHHDFPDLYDEVVI